MRQAISFIFLVAILTSCKHGVTPSEYVKYVEKTENGLHIEKQFNGVGYTLQYEPVAYCVMLEERSFNIPEDVFKKEYDRFKGLEHYVLRINKTDMDSLINKLGDTSKYKKGITEYFDFRIQKDIKLIEGLDTIPCSICQADANSGISEYYTFSLGFSEKNAELASAQEADRVIEYENKILHTGKISLVVTGKNIKNIPGLKIM
ncbi:MAG TPA: hypothetical protein VK783_00820 [Bacteroidia bacterium]|jgi:hypothetical protein|nr:hypothetical protein [Bacteroidia bacterium]